MTLTGQYNVRQKITSRKVGKDGSQIMVEILVRSNRHSESWIIVWGQTRDMKAIT